MSKENVISKKEPFARMVKRDHISVGKAWAIRLIAVALSLVVAALVIVAVTKQNPIEGRQRNVCLPYSFESSYYRSDPWNQQVPFQDGLPAQTIT